MGGTYSCRKTKVSRCYVVHYSDADNVLMWGIMEQPLESKLLSTLIEFVKLGMETVSMSKTCNFDSNISDFNSVDLKRPKNDQRPKKNFLGQI